LESGRGCDLHFWWNTGYLATYRPVKEPKLKDYKDALVRIIASAICGTDLHMVRGTLAGMVPGTILGHEGVGIVEAVGDDVRNFTPGDRVVISYSIACGNCVYCRASYFSQCDNANPNGKTAGTAFFGGPKDTGPFDGLQAELARVPFANVGVGRSANWRSPARSCWAPRGCLPLTTRKNGWSGLVIKERRSFISTRKIPSR
jgi:threonine dehydrogenase-like Zn-dependent dehydrogenase